MTGIETSAEVTIADTAHRVWSALTDPAQIERFFYGSRVETDWKVGSPIVWKGEYDAEPYEDKGEILAYDEPRELSMTHFSPLSGQKDEPESYHTLVYRLTEHDGSTTVVLTQDNCENEEQAEQFGGSWQQMLDGLKDLLEKG